MDPALESLAGRLHVEPERLSMLAGLESADLTRLDALVTETLAVEDAAVTQGFNDSLRLLPAPVRLALRKIVFGGRS